MKSSFPKSRREVRPRWARAEFLEPRRLLSAQLSLNASTGVMSFTQTSGVNDVLEVAISTSHDWFFDDTSSSVNIDGTLAGAGWSVTPDGHEALGPNLTQASSVQIDTNDGDDEVTIDETSVPITYQATGATETTLIVGDGNAGGTILSPITYNGASNGAGAFLTLDDAADANPRTIDMTSTSVTGLGSGSINFAPGVLDLLLEAGTGGNTIAVNDTTTGMPFSQNIQSSGDDTVNVNSSPAMSDILVQGASASAADNLTVFPQSSLGEVTENSISGLSSVTIDDSADTQARNITYKPSASGAVSGFSAGIINVGVKSLTLKGGSGGNTWTIDPPSTSKVAVANVDTGTGDDTVMVRTVPAAQTLNINNQGGNDSIDVLDDADTIGTASPTPSILGPIDVTNSAGSTSLKIDESASDTAHTVTVNGSQVSGLTQGAEQLSGVASISLVGSQAGDTFSVTPSASMAISIDGGPFAPAPNPTAKLDVNISGQTLPALIQSGTASNLSGSYSFSDAQPVSFSDMGQIAPIIGNVSGMVYDGQNLNAIAGATVFADENGNGVGDPGEPSTTTDASGNYLLAGILAGTVNLIVSANGTYVTQTKSVSIDESTTTAADVGLLPVPSANTADLVASFAGAVPAAAIIGSKGKLKFKVTNSGTTIAAGSPLLELFASADTSLDETDHTIATFSLGKIKLKPRASKILLTSFVYPASVPTGTYFLLASVDSTNVIAESREDDNVAATATAIRVAPAAIDLAGQFGRLAKVPLSGQAFSMSLSIDNLGNIPANGMIDVNLFASADQTLDAADQELAANQRFHIHIKPGGSHAVTLKIPSGVTMPGAVYLIASINSTHSLPESNFANNDVVSGATITIV